MPFDAGTIKHAKLLHLADVLDDRSMWPEGFFWNYGDCRQCAMGLACNLGMITATGVITGGPWSGDTIAAGLVPNHETAHALFFGGHPSFQGRAARAITPKTVATAIRQWVAEQP